MLNEISWIGLSDQENEGDYRWLNGDHASSSDQNLWADSFPNGGPFDDDCCTAYFNQLRPDVRDNDCSIRFHAVCEKRV